MATLSEPRLSIEMIPGSTWGTNVRSLVRRRTWDRVRYQVYAAAKSVCEVCGGTGRKHPVECHEVWSYEAGLVQRLVRLIALCPACHEVKHFGKATRVGRAEYAKAHLMAVNEWDEHTAQLHIARVYALWRDRNQYEWTVNIDAMATVYEVDLEEERAWLAQKKPPWETT